MPAYSVSSMTPWISMTPMMPFLLTVTGDPGSHMNITAIAAIITNEKTASATAALFLLILFMIHLHRYPNTELPL